MSELFRLTKDGQFVIDSESIRRAFGAWLQEKNLSVRRAAEQVGCSPATLSLLLNGKYHGDERAWVERLLAVLTNGSGSSCWRAEKIS